MLEIQELEFSAHDDPDPDFFYNSYKFKDYEQVEYYSCTQAFYDTLFVSGMGTQDTPQSKLFSFKIASNSEITQEYANKIADKNMFAHYHFRTKNEITHDFSQPKIDVLVFLSKPQVLIIGSTASQELVLLPGHSEDGVLDDGA